MILYIVTFIAAVITIIDLYYRFKENEKHKKIKSEIIRNILFPIIIALSIIFGAYEICNSIFGIFKVQDDMFFQEYNYSTGKKLLFDDYENEIFTTGYKYENEITGIDYKMRGESYENEIEKNELLKEKESLLDSLKNERLRNGYYGKAGMNYRYYDGRIKFIESKIAAYSQKDTLLTTTKVYEYHKNILTLMSERETYLRDLSGNFSNNLKLLELEDKERKKEIENERTKYVINLFLSFILFTVFTIIGIRKVYKYIERKRDRRMPNA